MFKKAIDRYHREHNSEKLQYYRDHVDEYVNNYKPFTSVLLELSSACNLKCSFCTQQYKQGQGRHMRYDEAVALINKLPESVVHFTLHFSGESFMNPDIDKIISFLSEKNKITRISTNGTLPPKVYLKALNCGLSELVFAIDGATPETHERYRIGSSQKKIVETLEAVCKEKPDTAKVGVQFLVTKFSESEIDDMRKLLVNIKCDFFNLKTISLDIASDERLEKEKLANAKAILPHDNRYSRYIREGDKLVLKYPIVVCPYTYQPVVTANGEIALCCIDLDKKTKIGNLHDYNSFDELWNTSNYRQIRAAVLEKGLAVCKNCNYSQIGLNPEPLNP